MALESLLLLSLCMSNSLSLLTLATLTPSQQGNQMDAVWKADVASSSHPIEEKTPTSLLWDHLGGCPDIPRQFTLDVHSFYHKSLMSLKAR